MRLTPRQFTSGCLARIGRHSSLDEYDYRPLVRRVVASGVHSDEELLSRLSDDSAHLLTDYLWLVRDLRLAQARERILALTKHPAEEVAQAARYARSMCIHMDRERASVPDLFLDPDQQALWAYRLGGIYWPSLLDDVGRALLRDELDDYARTSLATFMSTNFGSDLYPPQEEAEKAAEYLHQVLGRLPTDGQRHVLRCIDWVSAPGSVAALRSLEEHRILRPEVADDAGTVASRIARRKRGTKPPWGTD